MPAATTVPRLDLEGFRDYLHLLARMHSIRATAGLRCLRHRAGCAPERSPGTQTFRGDTDEAMGHGCGKSWRTLADTLRDRRATAETFAASGFGKRLNDSSLKLAACGLHRTKPEHCAARERERSAAGQRARPAAGVTA